MIKMGKIDFTDWLTKCTLVSTSGCILHRHTDWMTNHQEGKDLIYWCLGKKLSSGPPDSAVLSRHSGSKTGPGLKEALLEGAPVWWLTMLLPIPKNSNEYQCLKCTAISILILNVEKYWGRFHQDIETLQIWNTDADTAAYT